MKEKQLKELQGVATNVYLPFALPAGSHGGTAFQPGGSVGPAGPDQTSAIQPGCGRLPAAAVRAD